MSSLIQLMWSGLISGFAYSLVALGLVLVFKTARILNFAAGTMAGFGGFLAYWFSVEKGVPWGFAILLALLLSGVGTAIIERLTIRPLIGEKSFLPIVVMTLGIEVALANWSLEWWGGTAKSFPVPGSIDRTNWEISGVRFNAWHLVIAGATFATLAIVGYIVNRTELGLAMRAFAEDKEAAKLMGIKESTVSQVTWVLSALVGSVTGILYAPVLFLQPDYMNVIFIKGFVAAILGGFTSLSGGVFGGLLLGELEAFAVKYSPREFAAALPVVIVFIILLVRPLGLFTRAKSHERV
jgi:branched-chain amino acid transport system permease protein